MTADVRQIARRHRGPSRLEVDTPGRPRPARRVRRLPRWLRTALSVCILVSFFTASTALGLLASPLLLLPPRGRSGRFSRMLNRGLGHFARMLRAFGLVELTLPTLPSDVGRPVLVVANHPTFLDVVFLLGAMPELSCVVKASWYRSPLLGPLLRLAGYLPGPGLRGDEGQDMPVVRRIEDALRAGVSVLVFPEGTRSPWGGLHRFRRGAIEAARRAGATIVPILVEVDRPVLAKGQPAWHMPGEAPVYSFEWLDPIAPDDGPSASRQLARDLRHRYRDRLAGREDPCASD